MKLGSKNIRTYESLMRDWDLFLFQVYTSYNYNDLEILRKDQLYNDVEHGQYIISKRDKNDNPAIVPLFKFPYAKEIIARYMNTDPNNSLQFKKKVFIEVQVYNRNLKLLAKRANLVRPIE